MSLGIFQVILRIFALKCYAIATLEVCSCQTNFSFSRRKLVIVFHLQLLDTVGLVKDVYV